MNNNTNSEQVETNKIYKKSINNAISAYFMILISVFFLFNKKNRYLNNDFVKSHTKSAFLIHISFLLNYIVFISFGFLKNISILEYNLNYLIASSIFTILFIFLLYGTYKANKGKVFKISEFIKIGKSSKIIDVNGDGKIGEKDKLTLILSYIPFLGYYVQGKYYENKSVSEIIKFNLIVSTIISIIYISGNKNITLLLILFYIIFSVFSSINILTRETIIGINLKNIKSPSQIIELIKIYFIYLKNYLSKKDFLGIENIKKNFFDNKNKKEKIELLDISKLKESKISNIIIYTPFVNLISIFFINSNKKYHIINGIMITIFFILFIILDYLNYIPKNSYIILLFPIFFGIGYTQSKPNYKIPIIYDLFNILVSIKNIFTRTKKIIKKKKEEVHKETIKVK